jgi:hypothetical protein
LKICTNPLGVGGEMEIPFLPFCLHHLEGKKKVTFATGKFEAEKIVEAPCNKVQIPLYIKK